MIRIESSVVENFADTCFEVKIILRVWILNQYHIELTLMIDKASTRLTKYAADFLDPLKQNNTTQVLKLKDGLPSQANGSCIPINWSDFYCL